MAHVLTQTRIDTLFDNRMATGGGVLGMLACGLLATLMVHAAAHGPSDDDLDELPFMPGMVMALGSPQAESVTTPSVVEPSEPSETAEPSETTEPSEPDDDSSVEDAVTDEITPPEPPRPPKPRPPSSSPPSNKLPPSNRLPSPPKPQPPSRGNPFGDPEGFDDLNKSGDDWARGVIAALNAMDVGTVYAKPVSGTVRFQMTICKDGRVSRVNAKGGTATADERDLVLLEVERLKIPRPPGHIASQMNGSCVKLEHTFSWSTRGTR